MCVCACERVGGLTFSELRDFLSNLDTTRTEKPTDPEVFTSVIQPYHSRLFLQKRVLY